MCNENAAPSFPRWWCGAGKEVLEIAPVSGYAILQQRANSAWGLEERKMNIWKGGRLGRQKLPTSHCNQLEAAAEQRGIKLVYRSYTGPG